MVEQLWFSVGLHTVMGMLEYCGVGYVEHFAEISHFNQAVLYGVPGELCRDIFEMMPEECEGGREYARQAGTHSLLHPCCPGDAGKVGVCMPGGGHTRATCVQWLSGLICNFTLAASPICGAALAMERHSDASMGLPG